MIRAMIPADISEALSLRLSTVENVVTVEDFKNWGISEESLTKALASNVKGWVYEHAGKLAGFVMGNQSSGEVLVLAVYPQHEKNGVGSALLMQVQNWLFEHGHDELWLKTTPDPSFRAYGFYLHHGWRPTGKTEEGDEIFMLSK